MHSKSNKLKKDLYHRRFLSDLTGLSLTSTPNHQIRIKNSCRKQGDKIGLKELKGATSLDVDASSKELPNLADVLLTENLLDLPSSNVRNESSLERRMKNGIGKRMLRRPQSHLQISPNTKLAHLSKRPARSPKPKTISPYKNEWKEEFTNISGDAFTSSTSPQTPTLHPLTTNNQSTRKSLRNKYNTFSRLNSGIKLTKSRFPRSTQNLYSLDNSNTLINILSDSSSNSPVIKRRNSPVKSKITKNLAKFFRKKEAIEKEKIIQNGINKQKLDLLRLQKLHIDIKNDDKTLAQVGIYEVLKEQISNKSEENCNFVKKKWYRPDILYENQKIIGFDTAFDKSPHKARYMKARPQGLNPLTKFVKFDTTPSSVLQQIQFIQLIINTYLYILIYIFISSRYKEMKNKSTNIEKSKQSEKSKHFVLFPKLIMELNTTDILTTNEEETRKMLERVAKETKRPVISPPVTKLSPPPKKKEVGGTQEFATQIEDIPRYIYSYIKMESNIEGDDQHAWPEQSRLGMGVTAYNSHINTKILPNLREKGGVGTVGVNRQGFVPSRVRKIWGLGREGGFNGVKPTLCRNSSLPQISFPSQIRMHRKTRPFWNKPRDRDSKSHIHTHRLLRANYTQQPLYKEKLTEFGNREKWGRTPKSTEYIYSSIKSNSSSQGTSTFLDGANIKRYNVSPFYVNLNEQYAQTDKLKELKIMQMEKNADKKPTFTAFYKKTLGQLVSLKLDQLVEQLL